MLSSDLIPTFALLTHTYEPGDAVAIRLRWPNLRVVYGRSLAGLPTPNFLNMAAPLLQIPPLDGSLTVIPGFVDFHAQHNADFPWTKFPSRTHPGQADAITFVQFAQATHRVAHKVRPRRQGSDGEVVTLLIHCDTILYVATLAGLMRANIVVSALVLTISVKSRKTTMFSLYQCLRRTRQRLLPTS